MVSDEAESLIQEIRTLREQYVAEVGEGRRVWPKSIKDRVQRLDEMGLSAREAADRTGVGYETFLQWRYQRRQLAKKQFHQVNVQLESKAVAKIGTVTVPKINKSRSVRKTGTVTVTTPDGYRVELPDLESAVSLLKGLTKCS
ncbi:MAG: hypothetical protein AB7G93_23450 [Bdellovibrionales bacterium]